MEPFKIKISDRFKDESPESRRRRLMAFRFIDTGATALSPIDPDVDRLDGGSYNTSFDYALDGGEGNTTFSNYIGGGNASSFMDNIPV